MGQNRRVGGFFVVVILVLALLAAWLMFLPPQPESQEVTKQITLDGTTTPAQQGTTAPAQ